MKRLSVVATASLLLALGCGSGDDETSLTGLMAVDDDAERDNSNPLADENLVRPNRPGGPGDWPRFDLDAAPLLQVQVENILARTCGACHGADGTAEAGMNYIDNMAALIENRKVLPGNADESPVVVRILDGSMPPPGFFAPTADEIQQIIMFINTLSEQPVPSPEGPWPDLVVSRCDVTPVSFDALFATLRDDLLAQSAGDRPFLRYVSLSNRYNARHCDSNLLWDRDAVSKLINSLSARSRIAVPVAVNADELIYRIDLRDYRWEEEVDVDGTSYDDAWEAIVDSTPYAVPFEGDDANTVANETGASVPVLNADALVDIASTGSVYYGILGVPNRVNDLFNDLGVDAEAQRTARVARRAGTASSGLSRQDRVVERLEIGPEQSLWQSFEFRDGNTDNNIFVSPLALDPGETEVLYTLSNGLQGYATFGEQGERLNESRILFDSVSGSFLLKSGVSCMSCHARGYMYVRDEVRNFVESEPLNFTAEELDQVRELYPLPSEMDAIMDADRAVYLAALQELDILTELADPVSTVALRFGGRLGRTEVAAELGVSVADLVENLAGLDTALAPLANEGTTIPRSELTRVFPQTLCAMQGASTNRPAKDFCDAL